MTGRYPGRGWCIIDPMTLDSLRTGTVLATYRELGLLSAREVEETLALLSPTHPLSRAVALADSIHLHVKVDDTARLPRERLLAAASVENEQEGYVKFAHAGGVNLIFSSIPVAEDEKLPGGDGRARPFVDHVGVDLRREDAVVRGAFDEARVVAIDLGWGAASQGGTTGAVFCCHTQVEAKHWVFPPTSPPIELAFGRLVVHGGQLGCDLRPIDPRHARAKEIAPCCGAPSSEPVTLGRKPIAP